MINSVLTIDYVIVKIDKLRPTISEVKNKKILIFTLELKIVNQQTINQRVDGKIVDFKVK